MARTAAPRIARCEQNVWRRVCGPCGGIAARAPPWPTVGHVALAERLAVVPLQHLVRLARAGCAASSAAANRRVSGTYRTRPPFVAVRWPCHSLRSTRSCLRSESTSVHCNARISPARNPASPPISTTSCATVETRRAPPPPALRTRRSCRSGPSPWCPSQPDVHRAWSSTRHSTAFFNIMLSTVSTLFTVSGLRCRSWYFSRCTSSSVIVSRALAPSVGSRWVLSNQLLVRDAARLLLVRARMAVHETRRERLRVGTSFLGLRRPVHEQIAFTRLCPPRAADFERTETLRRSRYSVPVGRTMRMSASHPPRRYGRILTLIAYSCRDDARFWSSQCSRSSDRTSSRRPIRVTPGNWPRAAMTYTAARVERRSCAVSSTVSSNGSSRLRVTIVSSVLRDTGRYLLLDSQSCSYAGTDSGLALVPSFLQTIPPRSGELFRASGTLSGDNVQSLKAEEVYSRQPGVPVGAILSAPHRQLGSRLRATLATVRNRGGITTQSPAAFCLWVPTWHCLALGSTAVRCVLVDSLAHPQRALPYVRLYSS